MLQLFAPQCQLSPSEEQNGKAKVYHFKHHFKVPQKPTDKLKSAAFASIRHNTVTAWLELCWSLAATTALSTRGMDSSRPLEACCGICHLDVSNRSLTPTLICPAHHTDAHLD